MPPSVLILRSGVLPSLDVASRLPLAAGFTLLLACWRILNEGCSWVVWQGLPVDTFVRCICHASHRLSSPPPSLCPPPPPKAQGLNRPDYHVCVRPCPGQSLPVANPPKRLPNARLPNARRTRSLPPAGVLGARSWGLPTRWSLLHLHICLREGVYWESKERDCGSALGYSPPQMRQSFGECQEENELSMPSCKMSSPWPIRVPNGVTASKIGYALIA